VTAYLLDTNHLSPLVTLGHSLRNKILAQVQVGDSFAIALRYDLHLLTTDQDFVTIPDLKLDNWW
jgi:serine/threonine protein phosphatase PrpC